MLEHNGSGPSQAASIESMMTQARSAAFAVQPEGAVNLAPTEDPGTYVAEAANAEEPPVSPTADQMYQALQEHVAGPVGSVDLTMGDDGVVQACIKDKCFLLGEGEDAFGVAKEFLTELVAPELLRIAGFEPEVKSE